MEIVVTGRHVQVSDRFREHLDDKLAKVPQLAPRVQRLDVVVTHEANPRQAKECDKVEITCYVKGPVIRAEACATDKYAALDVAIDKLFERLRRAHDRKRVHRGRHAPESVSHATARSTESFGGGPATLESRDPMDGGAGADVGESPIEVRAKVHWTSPMTLDQALYEMELVGQDFYLFHDSDTDRASVVYRRRGWSYGVLHLDVGHRVDPDPASTVDDRVPARL